MTRSHRLTLILALALLAIAALTGTIVWGDAADLTASADPQMIWGD